ncbi:MAG: SGNH/GDSL hydrolase family protein [Oscillospiraceae bacterium]|nr:SGNH/GDSL hydrolase family protein [Oscillospiraceae bacterium]
MKALCLWFCSVGAFGSLLWGSVLRSPPRESRKPAVPVAEALAYPLDAYVREAYMKPLWDGGIVYQESVMPLARPDGSIGDIPLLYAADEILSLRGSDLRTEYVQGVDYALVDGKLRILDGAIPQVPWGTLYPPQAFEAPPGSLVFPGKTGEVPWLWIEGGSLFHTWQLSVTYRHSDAYAGHIPPRQGCLLPKTLAKLETGGPLRVLVYGDSIAVGAQSSGWCDAPPYAPAWYGLFAEELMAQYSSEVTVVNTAVGGTASAWGADNAAALAAEQHPDLAVIAFGMNDGSGGVRTSGYIWNTLKIMARVRAQNPNCEFILIATTLPNPLSSFATGQHEAYRSWLLRLAQRGVAVADLTAVHQDMLSIKRFEDFNSNNINHPNDFLARVYAQVLIETVKQ